MSDSLELHSLGHQVPRKPVPPLFDDFTADLSLRPYESYEEISRMTPSFESKAWSDNADTERLIEKPPRHRSSGWQGGLKTCIGLVVAMGICNFAVTIWVGATQGFTDGIAHVYEGACSDVNKGDLIAHLLINLLSTILLGASNYAMQILSAPTRQQVDSAHRANARLDIGVPSIRNLRSVPRRQLLLWIIIACSSLPLHVMYNSVVFSAITASEYTFAVVNSTFIDPSTTYNHSLIYEDYHYLRDLALNGTLRTVNTTECISIFATDFVTTARNVLLITSNSNNTLDYLASIPGLLALSSWESDEQVPFYWTCGSGWDENPYKDNVPVCTREKALAGADDWYWDDSLIDYCMVQDMEESCKLEFNLPLMIIVIIANTCKAVAMFLTLRTAKVLPLVTIGDGIRSFLENPDSLTEGMCLASKKTFKTQYKSGGTARPWRPVKHRWFAAASPRRWLVCNCLCLLSIFIVIYLFTQSLTAVGTRNLSKLADLGFGTINPGMFLSMTFSKNGLIGAVMLANLPQLIFSFLYLMYNGLYTCMLEAWEWSRFGDCRKALRVTAPSGGQRSTRYLQLPYRFSMPLLIFSGALHWVISESLFLAYVPIANSTGGMESPLIAVGYSSIAIFTALMIGIVALAVVNLVGFFGRYSPNIPLVGSSSILISAACHPPPEDKSAAYLPLKWGVVKMPTDDDEVGHCSLTSFEVTTPEVGKLYA